MFTINQRVIHTPSGLMGTVMAQRINMELGKEEIRVLFDDQDHISAWAAAGEYEGA